ncbi:hypothetical protein C8R43DRAFT_1015186 [Mycena crocata]|nr:hypothetical protein C8R43DRAFT_1015186 [Mycena crocata]
MYSESGFPWFLCLLLVVSCMSGLPSRPLSGPPQRQCLNLGFALVPSFYSWFHFKRHRFQSPSRQICLPSIQLMVHPLSRS